MINTLHKEFNRQANHPKYGYIGKGNVFSDTQCSTYIRSFNTIESNGFEYGVGELRDFDLAYFRNNGKNIEPYIKTFVEYETAEKTCILYKIRHIRIKKGIRKQIIHGYILTTTDDKLITYWTTNHYPKSYDIMEKVIDYLKLER